MTIPPKYNLTTIGNGTGAVDLIQKVNTNLMGGWFGTFTLIAFFALFMLGFIKVTGDGKKAFTTTSFIVFILAVLFRGLELIPDLVLYSLLGVLAISIAFSIKG